jgi:anti-anti-sigma regulatory factor
MTTIAEWYKMDGAHLGRSIDEVRERLSSTEAEVVLDFSAVPRIDTAGLQQLEKLAGAAEEKSAKITLRGVNVGIYKVLKLARLTSRFSFEQ